MFSLVRTCATGAATEVGVTGAVDVPGIEIFGGVTGFGVGGVPAFGAVEVAAPDCGLLWKYVTHSAGTELGSA